MVAVTPLFILGLAALVDAVCGTSRGRWRAAFAVGLVLVVWNAGFMLQWGTNLVPNRGPVDFAVVAKNQVTVVPRAMWDFLGKYFRQRDALVHAVERGDIPERSRYEIKR